MSDLVAPDHAKWEQPPPELQDRALILDDSRELREPGFDSSAILLFSFFSAVHIFGSIVSIAYNGASKGNVFWLVAGIILGIYTFWAAMRSHTRARTYYLLPEGIVRIDRYGRYFLPRDNVDDLITREISDNGRPAVELLLVSGDWIQMKVRPDEVEKVQRWFDE